MIWSRNTLALLAIFITWFCFSWPWFFGDKIIPYDAKNHFYPMIRFVAHAWHSGESAIWSPYHFGGFPMIADPQSTLWTLSLRIPSWVSAAPSIALVDFIHLAHLLAGAFAIFAFGRSCGWRHEASVLAAFVYMLSGAPTFRLEHMLMTVSYMWTAIALWRLDVLMRKGGLWRGLLFGVSLAFLLVDRNHIAYLGAWFIFAYWLSFVVRDVRNVQSIKVIFAQHWPVMIGGLLALMLVAIPVILLLQLAQNSNRPQFELLEASWQSLHPASMLSFFLPEIFGALDGSVAHWGPSSKTWGGEDLQMFRSMLHMYSGILPIILVFWFGIGKAELFTKNVRFFAFAAIFFLVYSLGRYNPLFGSLYAWVPGVDLFRRPSDGLFLFALSIALLTGALANRIDDMKLLAKQIWLPVFLIFMVLSYALWVAVTHERFSSFAFSLLLPGIIAVITTSLIICAVKWENWRTQCLALLVLVTGFDLAYHATNNRMNALRSGAYAMLETPDENPLASKVLALMPEISKGPWRVELIGLGAEAQNLPQVISAQATLGYNPLRLSAVETYIAPDMQNSAARVRNFGQKMTGYDSNVTNQLGIRYVVSGAPLSEFDPNLPEGRFEFLETFKYGQRSAHIYENRLIEPRAMLLSTDGEARITHYTNTEIRISVEADRADTLVLHDFDYPGWLAYVDGEEVPITRHDDMFRAITVPAGESEVIFRFEPLSLRNLSQALKGFH